MNSNYAQIDPIIEEKIDQIRKGLIKQNLVIKINNENKTVPRTKISEFKIYLKLLYCFDNKDQVKMTIIDSHGQIQIHSGDYYLLNVGKTYFIYNSLIVNDEYILQFDSKVSFIWVPEFMDQLENARSLFFNSSKYFESKIILLRKGLNKPENQYYYNIKSCEKEVQITSHIGVSFIKEKSYQNSYHIQFLNPPTIKHHEKITILQVQGESGFIKYNNQEGWISIRYVTYFGNGGRCQCEYCQNNRYKGLPIEAQNHDLISTTYNKINDTMLKEQISNTFLQQILVQYQRCSCAHCLNVKNTQIKQYYVDPSIELLGKYYQKYNRCINFQEISQYIYNIFHVLVSYDQLQKMYTQKLVKKIRQSIPQLMMDDLHKLSLQCTRDQYSIFKDTITEEMKILMSQYDTVQVKNNIKNWITRPKKQNINIMIINNEELELSIKRIVFQYVQYNNMSNNKELQENQNQEPVLAPINIIQQVAQYQEISEQSISTLFQ
ncbi:Hypothetical_protein [Hexamita inflata]|uniref:Hypothetical_protein n=1 Tax=Hexamita inflata TaxID=28002 RepID=A0AA86NS33_9EUKA|nr:Hypothetical protein HINF_LOCUS11918 [Hexamita inflata]